MPLPSLPFTVRPTVSTPRSSAALRALPAIQYLWRGSSPAPWRFGGRDPVTASTIRSRSKTPTIASMPGAHSSILARCRCTRHPATTTRLTSPASLAAMASLITERDSSLLASRNPHVLMTTASAPPKSGSPSYEIGERPASASRPSIFSESTRFLGQPKLMSDTVRAGPEVPFLARVVAGFRGTGGKSRKPLSSHPAGSAHADLLGHALGGHARHGVVLAQSLAQLQRLGDQELAVMAEAPTAELQGSDKAFLRRAEHEVIATEVQGQDAELPRLSA